MCMIALGAQVGNRNPRRSYPKGLFPLFNPLPLGAHPLGQHEVLAWTVQQTVLLEAHPLDLTRGMSMDCATNVAAKRIFPAAKRDNSFTQQNVVGGFTNPLLC